MKLEPAGGPHMVEGLSIARDDDCRAVERDEEDHQQHADALLANMCVFRVVHGNPSRLKRPLDKEDDLSGNDIAIRLYDVVERENCEEISAAPAALTSAAQTFSPKPTCKPSQRQ